MIYKAVKIWLFINRIIYGKIVKIWLWQNFMEFFNNNYDKYFRIINSKVNIIHWTVITELFYILIFIRIPNSKWVAFSGNGRRYFQLWLHCGGGTFFFSFTCLGPLRWPWAGMCQGPLQVGSILNSFFLYVHKTIF